MQNISTYGTMNMNMRGRKQKWVSVLLSLFLGAMPLTVYAQSSTSPNYRVDQTLFGTGGELDASSSNYRARQTTGELGVGNTASANYQAYAGFNTTDDPFIEFVVTGNTINLGYLSTSSPSTATGNFYVRAWQSGGYVVRTESNPPTNTVGGQQLNAMAAAAASAPGTEQFGINLKDNTSPDIGTEPQQVPDNTFSFGQIASGYGTVNQFKYAKGDIIARATQSTSVTIYTMSYIFNINENTPAGQYIFRHILVVTGSY